MLVVVVQQMRREKLEVIFNARTLGGRSQLT
jgi:hypothetical protein